MLWEHFGGSMNSVPIEEVFELSTCEVEVFISLKYYSIAYRLSDFLGLAPYFSMSDTITKEDLLDCIDYFAEECKTLEEHREISSLRNELNNISIAILNNKV
jgi:hypothetical protein